MMTIPWTRTSAPAEPATPAVVQVSRLVLRRRRDVAGFLIAALRVRRAVLRAPGALGVSLRADVRHRTFFTLSAWVDEPSIRAFVGSPAHRAVMASYRDRMAGSHFHTWVPGTAGTPSWDDAIDLLGAVTTA